MIPVDDLFEICCVRSKTLRAYRKDDAMTLGDFIAVQAEKVKNNREIKPLMDSEDFFARLREFAAERLGTEAAEKIAEAAGFGTILTADHHGGIFCAQTFQCDLLFGEILKELGSESAYVPVMSGGQVELDSSTYARGICLNTARDKKVKIPFFSSRPAARTAYNAPAISPDMVKRLKQYVSEEDMPERAREAVFEILASVYESEAVLSSRRYEDQVTRIGAGISEGIFGKEGPVLTYLEAERLNTPLLIKELREKKSPLARMLSEPSAVRLMQEEKLSDGASVADILFRTSDTKGRNISLRLTEYGRLSGMDWSGNEVTFPADTDSLAALLEEEKLIPGFFLIACAVFFERGITWMGGVFQTEYLPEWKTAFANVIEKMGMKAEAETVRKYDCSAYVCGPMFALYGGNGFANPAGPVEFWMKKPDYGSVAEMMRKTRFKDAHLIGLSEMYYDLSRPDERLEGWYEKTGTKLALRYPENVLIND